MFNLVNLLPNLLSFVISYFFYRLLQAFAPMKENNLWRVLTLVCYAAIFSVGSFSNENIFVTLSLFLFFTLVTLLAFQGQLFQKIAIIIILYPVVLGINYLCYDLGFQLFLMSDEDQLTGALLIAGAFLLKTLIWWLIYQFFYRHLADCHTFLTNKMWAIMMLISLTPFLSLVSLITFTPKIVIFIYPAILACIVTALGIIYLTGYMAKTLKTEMENRQLKLQETYYEELAHNQLEIRKLSHDLNHHLGVIATLIEKEDNVSLHSYFEQLTVQFATSGKDFCQNNLVNAVLNSKFQHIEDNQIDTFINIDIDALLAIDDVSLCALFANTIDNAIEAVLAIDDPNQRKLSIEACYTAGYFSFAISNSKQHAIQENRHGLVTTKQDKKKHGFGLQTVKGIVDRYHGTLDLSHTDQEFNLVVLISEV